MFPRYLADREVHAKRARLPDHGNMIKLDLAATLDCSQEHFPQAHLMHMKKHSPVTEVVSLTDRVLVALQKSGVCTVFKLSAPGQYAAAGYLNHHPDEVIRSLFLNHACSSLVVVSVYPAQGKSILRCRSIKVADVELGKFQASVPILAQELLCFPGWVEICEVNDRILTFTSDTQLYKVWTLDSYVVQYEIPVAAAAVGQSEEERILDVKTSPGFLLVLYEPKLCNGGSSRMQKVRLLDIIDGKELYCYMHRLGASNSTNSIKLLEQFGESLLVKEDGEEDDLFVINLRTQPLATPYRVELTPAKLEAFSILHKANLFVTFQADGRIATHSCLGKLLCELYPASTPQLKSGKVVLAKDQETLVSVRQTAVPEKPDSVMVELKRCCGY
ncbi:hypothetical protein BASA81_002473 [Batrachochytrium salamandrivorans]|nr:hypothetical protein BASA81_002473 [Batrachochytrium salamandrivorans]